MRSQLPNYDGGGQAALVTDAESQPTESSLRCKLLGSPSKHELDPPRGLPPHLHRAPRDPFVPRAEYLQRRLFGREPRREPLGIGLGLRSARAVGELTLRVHALEVALGVCVDCVLD